MTTKKTSTGPAVRSVATKGATAKKTAKAPAKPSAKLPTSLKQGSFTAKRVLVKSGQATPAQVPAGGKMVRVDMELTEKQKADLEKLTGKKIKSLRLTVQDLADLANVILN